MFVAQNVMSYIWTFDLNTEGMSKREQLRNISYVVSQNFNLNSNIELGSAGTREANA